jgi:PAS domain S-box-containing protein
MTTPIRLLLVEDSEDDAALILRELKRAACAIASERVDSVIGLRAALAGHEWDVITCDYVMPGFGAVEAIETIRAHDAIVPIIIVSGEVGEEVGGSVMRAGAQDYVSKHRLARLAPAIERELSETKSKRARLRMEHELRESDQRYRKLVEQSHDIIWSVDASGRITSVNRATDRILGYAPEEILGRPFADIMGPGPGPQPLDVFPSSIDTDAPFEFIAQLMHRDGTRVDLRSSVTPLRDAAGSIVGYGGVAIDLSERLRIERALAESQDRLRAILDSSHLFFALVDREGYIMEFNSLATSFSDLLHAKSLHRGSNVSDFVSDAEKHNLKGYLSRTMSGDSLRFEQCLSDREGSDHWFDVCFTPVRGEAGVSAVCVSMLDVTERVKSQEVLRIREVVANDKNAAADRELLSAALERATASIMLLDVNGMIVHVNSACEQLTGFAREELCGRSANELTVELDSVTDQQVASSTERNGSWRGDRMRRHKNGTLYEVDEIVSAISDDSGRVVSYLSVTCKCEVAPT